jgi:hypothetical protein
LDGVDREPGDHLGLLLPLDLTRLGDDVTHEGLEHLGRHAHVALQQLANLPPHGDDVPATERIRAREYLTPALVAAWERLYDLSHDTAELTVAVSLLGTVTLCASVLERFWGAPGGGRRASRTSHESGRTTKRVD